MLMQLRHIYLIISILIALGANLYAQDVFLSGPIENKMKKQAQHL